MRLHLTISYKNENYNYLKFYRIILSQIELKFINNIKYLFVKFTSRYCIKQ